MSSWRDAYVFCKGSERILSYACHIVSVPISQCSFAKAVQTICKQIGSFYSNKTLFTISGKLDLVSGHCMPTPGLQAWEKGGTDSVSRNNPSKITEVV
jgi:hypothetical protein